MKPEQIENIQIKLILFSILERINAEIKDHRFFEAIDQEVFCKYLILHGFQKTGGLLGGASVFKLSHKTDIIIYSLPSRNPNFYLFMLDNMRQLSKHFGKSQLAIVSEILALEATL